MESSLSAAPLALGKAIVVHVAEQAWPFEVKQTEHLFIFFTLELVYVGKCFSVCWSASLDCYC